MPKQRATLTLVRHAIAEPKRQGLVDPVRALTAEGRRAFQTQAKRLAELGSVKGILTSPLVRAVQTAELLATATGTATVRVHSALKPHWRAANRIIELALELDPGWVLVGHNPSLDEAAVKLLGVKRLPRKLRKGAALGLRRDGRGFALSWMALPGKALVEPTPEED